MNIFLKVGLVCFFAFSSSFAIDKSTKVDIKAIAIPLADHYAGIVAYEKYKDKMKFANYKIMLLNGPNLVRSYFYSQDDADIAFEVAPMVMDMFADKQNFRWVSLIHRDGDALSINEFINKKAKLKLEKKLRKPDGRVAKAIRELNKENSKPVDIAIPSFLATHTTILYKYLKDNNITFSYKKDKNAEVILRVVKPPKSPAYLKQNNTRSEPSAFEQSLPWGDIAEIKGFGHLAWYSKDVMKHKNGHVECIIIAKDDVIKNKREALKEVIYYIHKAGVDIERARKTGGKEFDEIIKMIRKHIPAHSVASIKESLRTDIMAINYKNLNIDEESKSSFKEIMDLAYEAGFIKQKIDIDSLADDSFSTDITKQN
jgi:NitT/TauT family transport system substrate-binding protein